MASKLSNFYRNPINDFNEKELVFQSLEWLEFNEIIGDEDEMSVDEDKLGVENKEDEKYIIRIFGINKAGNSICLNVHNFTPFFYIKVPDSWKSQNVKIFLSKLAEFLSKSKKKVNEIWETCDYSKNVITKKCVLQLKKDFYGFSNNKEYKFLRLTFDNSSAMKKAVSIIKSHNSGTKKLSGFGNLPLYEANLDPVIKFAHIKNLKFSGWLKIKDFTVIDQYYSKSNCQIECDTDWSNVSLEEDNSNAPILQASYDIETYSIDGSFPSPDIKGNVITQIATSFKFFGQKDFYLKHIICLKKCSPLDDPNSILECYDTEQEVLIAWAKLIVKMDPDILYQYNGDQFDGNYLYTRAKLLDCDQFFSLGKLKNINATLNKSTFSSSAYGNTSFKRLVIPGRINFDILIYIKREYKENSYKLDYVAEKYLGQNKNPVTAKMMFQYFEEGDPDKIKLVAEYCIVDTLLPQKLVDKMHILQNQISMSNVTFVPIRYLIERGQQIKVFSQILKETRKQNFLVPTIDNYSNKNVEPENSDDEEDSFTGATVLPPLKGAYYEPITVCDFASLYPSIIRAHNLCFSTIVLDNSFDDLPNVDYKVIEWEDVIDGKIINRNFKYVQNSQGILPKLLAELTIERKNYKKLMNSTEDPFLSEVYNKCQLAVKVSMNSIYGFLAAPMLCCKPIAATVTAIGRLMIKDTKDYMEKNYNASVAVYGDSVTGHTPLLLKDPTTNKIHIETIQSILNEEELISYPGFKANDYSIREDKVYSKTHYQVWTDLGWSPIKKVIRHKTHKKIYKVLTDTGMVEVTEDHSLLDENCKIIKPKECDLNTRLLSSYPATFNSSDYSISKNKAILYGFFYSNGSCNSTWALNNSDMNVLNYLKNLLEIEYPDVKFTVSSHGVYKLISENHKNLVEEYKILFYDTDGYKKVPTEILNSNENTIQAFLEGYFMADECRNHTIFDNKEQIGSAGLYFLTKKLGYKVSLNTTKDTLRMTITKENQCKNPNQIKKIECQDYGEIYVYDLETEIGRFNAGVGDIQVKNTDSVFIKFVTASSKQYKIALQTPDYDKNELDKLKVKCIQESIDIGKIAAKNATQDLFTFPINLEYEKVYHPLLLLSKKRYIGILYSEDPTKPDKMDNKGVVLKRRDNFELLKKTYSKIIDILMQQGETGINQAKDYIEEILYKIINNEFTNLDDFIISKTLKDTYKSKNIPHLVLAQKLNDRDPGSAPKSNDRVPYVFTYPDINTEIGKQTMEYIDNKRKQEFVEKVSERYDKKIKSFDEAVVINKTLQKKVLLKKGKLNQYEKVEDPDYLLKHNLPLDAEYYINFMKTPLCEILSLFIENSEKIFDDIIKEYQNSKW